jgi:hypothetical protein
MTQVGRGVRWIVRNTHIEECEELQSEGCSGRGGGIYLNLTTSIADSRIDPPIFESKDEQWERMCS